MRVSSPELVTVQGPGEKDFKVMVDLEVRTDGVAPQSLDDVLNWFEAAHETEKAHFFRLISPALLEKLL